MKKLAIWLVLLLISGIMPNLMACGDDGQGTPLTPVTRPSGDMTSEPETAAEPVKIIIGNLTDITGPSSNAQTIINMALDDLVEYYNSKGLIPGVELKVISYDGQLDPSQDVPGYKWLMERGADLIVTGIPDTPMTLKPLVNKDKVPLFGVTGYQEQLDPPGYVFIMGTIPEHQAYTILDWIAENDWDYKARGPAKIGGASWPDGYSKSFLAAMKGYAEAHPERFEWIGGYSSSFKFTWGTEVNALQDCDYVFPCVNPVAFVREYRDAGHQGKFICSDGHTGFLYLINDADLWDEIDGSLFIRGGSLWWNEEGPLIDLTRELLYENHPGEAEEIIRAGNGYLSVSGIFYPILDMISDTVQEVGAENFDSQALYEAAISYSLEIEGAQRARFTATKRYSLDNYMIDRASAADRDIVSVNSEEKWVPALVEP